MRGIVMAYAIAAAMVAWTAAVAQNNQPSPPAGGSAQTTGQADPGPAPRQAPPGHRQPRAQDVPPEIQDNYGVRSPEDEELRRKLRICRDC